MPTNIKDNDIQKGRRVRLRERLLNSKLNFLFDYEILELFLYLSIPRKDVKPIAKELIQHFKSIGNIVNSEAEELSKISGLGISSISNFKLLKEIVYRINRESVSKRDLISSKDELVTYLRSSIGFKQKENIHVLYLNSKNQLIKDKIIDYGTANKVTIYPREVVKEALDSNSTAVIICHNHPSGDTKPSQADIKMTHNLQSALNAVEILLHDHVIISPSGYFSFKSERLI